MVMQWAGRATPMWLLWILPLSLPPSVIPATIPVIVYSAWGGCQHKGDLHIPAPQKLPAQTSKDKARVPGGGEGALKQQQDDPLHTLCCGM